MDIICCWFFVLCGNHGDTCKCGIRKTDSDVATAIRTVVVLLFAWLMVFVTGAWNADTYISGKTLLF